MRKNGEFRFVAMTAFQSASEKSFAGARRMMPALLTSTSIWPVLARICAMTSADSFCVPRAEIGVVRDEFAARRLHRRAGLRQIAARHADDRCAFLRKRHANCLPNAPARAGDNDHFVFESS